MRRKLFSAEPGIHALPRPAVPALSPSAFVLCPLNAFPSAFCADWQCIQWVYLQALQQALAVVQPSLPERDLLAVWN
jgi:hypothetical protein